MIICMIWVPILSRHFKYCDILTKFIILTPDEFLLYQSVDEVATLIYKYRKETFVEK